mgnify:CR=1 FL=1
MSNESTILDKLTTLNSRIALFVAIATLLIISGSVYLISDLTSVSVSDSIQAANLVTNVLLTLALIIIYTNIAKSNRKQVSQSEDLVAAQERQSEIVEKQIEAEEKHREIIERQTEILSSQSEIMDKQAQISEHEATPVLAVDDYSINRDDVSVWMTNYGESPAKDLSLEIEIRSDDEEIDLESLTVPLNRTKSTGGNIVATGEKNVQFEARNVGGRFRPNDRPHNTTFRDLMAELGSEEVGELGIELYVSYLGPLESESRTSVFPRKLMLLTPLPADSLPLGRCVDEGEFISRSVYHHR